MHEDTKSDVTAKVAARSDAIRFVCSQLGLISAPRLLTPVQVAMVFGVNKNQPNFWRRNGIHKELNPRQISARRYIYDLEDVAGFIVNKWRGLPINGNGQSREQEPLFAPKNTSAIVCVCKECGARHLHQGAS